jgi:hypothetical protein
MVMVFWAREVRVMKEIRKNNTAICMAVGKIKDSNQACVIIVTMGRILKKIILNLPNAVNQTYEVFETS